MSNYIDVDKIGFHKVNVYGTDRWVAYLEEVDEIPIEEGLVPRKNGVWLMVEDQPGSWDCSVCHLRWHKVMTNFCPYCGAKMINGPLAIQEVKRGEDEEEAKAYQEAYQRAIEQQFLDLADPETGAL